MKLQAYKYKKGNATLEFSFEENEDIDKNKSDFKDLLKEATKELEQNN